MENSRERGLNATHHPQNPIFERKKRENTFGPTKWTARILSLKSTIPFLQSSPHVVTAHAQLD